MHPEKTHSLPKARKSDFNGKTSMTSRETQLSKKKQQYHPVKLLSIELPSFVSQRSGDFYSPLQEKKSALPQQTADPTGALSHSQSRSWTRRGIKLLVLSRISVSVTVPRNDAPWKEYLYCQVIEISPNMRNKALFEVGTS